MPVKHSLASHRFTENRRKETLGTCNFHIYPPKTNFCLMKVNTSVAPALLFTSVIVFGTELYTQCLPHRYSRSWFPMSQPILLWICWLLLKLWHMPSSHWTELSLFSKGHNANYGTWQVFSKLGFTDCECRSPHSVTFVARTVIKPSKCSLRDL